MNTKRMLRSLFWITGVVLVLLGSVTTGASARSTAHVAAALARGGQVIPPQEEPKGYSLANAAAATAYFNTLGFKAPDDIPEDFPFQILYVTDPTTDTSNTFSVKAGTMFYVPVVQSDDTDAQYWPFPDVTDPAAVSAYYFDPLQLGADFIRITVDGKMTNLGPEYAVGAETPGLPSGGNNYTVVAAFLTNLSKGSHTVTIASRFSGAFIINAFGGAIEFPTFTYTITVY